MHVLLFALPVGAGILARPRWWWAVALLFGLHAGLSEVVQARVLAQRSGELADVWADLVGVVVGVCVACWLVGRRAPVPLVESDYSTPRPRPHR